ncbi:hybrid sensor histidine kinase/response regulator [Opitutus terrae]|uniref:histidine kinase n=1 Tax=Opitutus terrae (strain DSM 11246 / JCM 15787 / PB90-1) TaxID=452637 RepID=B1ZXM5_OPITP|nr:hybrid sensor histidine kinase/response regulator [Opitutus terrae]ACB74247.1 response regulator receiver sensor signal transduction histidine kinase [Opitutus terrae PB90-1]
MSAVDRETPAARILVVDDQETNLRVLGDMLAHLGYDIVPALDGEQALRRLSSRPVDLILLDVLMPGLDGFEVCRRIRSNVAWIDIPIIFLSAADDKSLIVRALESGGVDYITKPFNAAELLSRVRTHLALKTARDRLRQLAEDKDELLGILAHDLKNHLGGMLMSVQLLNEKAKSINDSRFQRMGANILRATDQMLSFVKEFLANSEVDHGRPMKFQPVLLQDVAAAVVQRHAEHAQRKDIALLHEQQEEGPLVEADRAALEQVLDNLVSNALKFSPSGKTVRVVVGQTPDGRGEVRVADEGPGFTEQDKQQIFRRYRRLSARPTGGEPSTGLGLSIVKKLMQDMRGDLRLESTPDHGATFLLTFNPAPVPA